jgi:cytidyltransferase-like protein
MDAIQHRVVLVTGGFDPCHQGHVSYLSAARRLGDMLVVGLNSDSWLIRKKGVYFMDWEERAAVLQAMRSVDMVIQFDDRDGSARDAIRATRSLSPESVIIFANGGDRTADNIPEMDQQDVIFQFAVGGDQKTNSSSDILRRYAYQVLAARDLESPSFRGHE